MVYCDPIRILNDFCEVVKRARKRISRLQSQFGGYILLDGKGMESARVLGQVVGTAFGSTLAMVICALGRGLDFATTWVAIGQGRAVEAKPFAADVFHLLGHQTGLIAYETLITTPVIFLGCQLLQRVVQTRYAGSTKWQVFILVGVVSLIVAAHNIQFLF